MSLALALNNALSGLRLNQQSIAVLSQNIANVNTVGYSRQVINQSAVTIEGMGSGVQIDDITRKIDKYLQRSVQTQGSNYQLASSLDDYYQRLQSVLGKPGQSDSIDSYMTGYFNAMQQLAETPDTSSLKSNAVSSGVALAKQLSDLSANVYDLRFTADGEIADSVTAVNNDLDKLYDINQALTQAKALGQSTAGLLDSRDKLITDISQYINVSVNYDAAGKASIVGGSGVVLLEDGVKHKLQYNRVQSVSSLVEDSPLSALQVLTINEKGEQVGTAFPLISAGKSADVKSSLTTGKIAALQQIRDVKFPAILDQLDQLASKLRDAVNTVQNNGSGFPPATSLTGDRPVHASDQYSWTGAVRIAVLKSDGSPVQANYSDESYTGIRPLTLDLSRLNSGQGNGKPTMQTIIDEINNHFGAPGNKVGLGNINNIQLASDTNVLPSGATSLFNFDLDMENISADGAQVFVTGMTVLDDTGTNITNVTQTAPSIGVLPTGSYTTTNGSADVTVSLASTPQVSVGQKIYMGAPAGPVNGISAANLTGFFTVTAVNGNQVTFTSAGTATSSGVVNDASGVQAMPPYDIVGAGQQERLADRGTMQVDLTSSFGSKYYDITVNVSVAGPDGVVNTAPVTYRVANGAHDIYNSRYDATAAGAPATLTLPNTSQESMRAILVDANGNELPKINGKYVDAEGYLKLIGGNAGTSYSVAIDELDSTQEGIPDGNPPQKGTNWGFSHFFGLNNFFDSNDPTATGDTLHNAAYFLKVQDRLVQNANLISTGTLVKQEKGVASGNREVYTYARYSGDNSIAQQLAKLNTQTISFDPAGGLSATALSLQSYSSQILGFVSQRASEATDNATSAKTLYDGFASKLNAISGVNLDEELANTVTLQNAYSATARVVTVVNKMYEDLLQAF